MSAIHDLIAQISDPRLRERLATEWASASREKKFGLVFEDHLPELLPLHKARPRKGDLICRRHGSLKDVWQVRTVRNGVVTCVKSQDEAHPSEPGRGQAEPIDFAIDEVLVVREFGQPIFPALVPVDAVVGGPADAPWHTLIEADNYHALQLLDYLYAGQVDCIYIDPPYNTGARDWKYNNDYVDGNDGWRHSKWLAFMEKRLKLAKRLLKPDNGVLIVTIDEKEYLHLGMLLEQEFPEARIQMISTMINPASVARAGGFGRSDEYIFAVSWAQQHPRDCGWAGNGCPARGELTLGIFGGICSVDRGLAHQEATLLAAFTQSTFTRRKQILRKLATHFLKVIPSPNPLLDWCRCCRYVRRGTKAGGNGHRRLSKNAWRKAGSASVAMPSVALLFTS